MRAYSFCREKNQQQRTNNQQQRTKLPILLQNVKDTRLNLVQITIVFLFKITFYR